MRPMFVSLCIHAKFVSGAQEGGMDGVGFRFAYVLDTLGDPHRNRRLNLWKLRVCPLAKE